MEEWNDGIDGKDKNDDAFQRHFEIVVFFCVAILDSLFSSIKVV